MNKTYIVLAMLGIVALAIIGGIAIVLFRPDATATFLSMMVVLLAVGTTTLTLALGQSKQQEDIETIKRNTNGNLTRLIEGIRKGEITEETLSRIEIDAAKLIEKRK